MRACIWAWKHRSVYIPFNRNPHLFDSMGNKIKYSKHIISWVTVFFLAHKLFQIAFLMRKKKSKKKNWQRMKKDFWDGSSVRIGPHNNWTRNEKLSKFALATVKRIRFKRRFLSYWRIKFANTVKISLNMYKKKGEETNSNRRKFSHQDDFFVVLKCILLVSVHVSFFS